jgi:hypothetical protein
MSITKLTAAVFLLGILLGAGLLHLSSRMPSRTTATNEIERRVRAASVIVETTWRLEDGRQKCIISQILKQRQGATVYFTVGEEYKAASRVVREGVDYGEGQILFFKGFPPILESAVVYSDGRLMAFGEMPLRDFKAFVERTGKQEKP